MRKTVLGIVIILLLFAIGISMTHLRPLKKELIPKKIIPKFTFGKIGRELGEFRTIGSSVAKDNYLYVADLDNHRIQVLKINPDGNLFAQSTFGKKGTGLGEFDGIGNLVIKGDHLYVADPNNHRIQVLKINSDGDLFAQSIFGKKGTGLGQFKVLGEFIIIGGLVIKEDHLYVAERELHFPSIQVLKINPDGNLSAQSIFGKQGKGLGEF
ncbi:MAG: NHL repeat-containing protein, partial [Candidatus Desantisbacteria bacterium]